MKDLPQPAAQAPKDESKADHLKAIQQDSVLRKYKPVPEGLAKDAHRPGQYYRRYRTMEQLPKEARAFYQVAGELVKS